ncbi:MAG TPA: STAS-like domain-containing protein [Bacillota bacterium]|nr:STAS-like domain-containing protein [Bacillota bacterium]
MHMVSVHDVSGVNCITLEDGEKVYELVHPLLSKGVPVTLDFSGVRVFASSFFNSAVGQLFRDLDSDTLNRLLLIVNLESDGTTVLRRVIENSRQYYADPRMREAVDSVMDRQSEDADGNCSL